MKARLAVVRWPCGAVAAPPASGCHAYLSKSELLRLSTFSPTATAVAAASVGAAAVDFKIEFPFGSGQCIWTKRQSQRGQNHRQLTMQTVKCLHINLSPPLAARSLLKWQNGTTVWGLSAFSSQFSAFSLNQVGAIHFAMFQWLTLLLLLLLLLLPNNFHFVVLRFLFPQCKKQDPKQWKALPTHFRWG